MSYIIVGAACFILGVCVSILFLCIVLWVKNNEYHVEEVDVGKERENFENRRYSDGKER